MLGWGRLQFYLARGGGVPPHPKPPPSPLRAPPPPPRCLYCNGVGWDGAKSFDCQN